VKVLVAYASKTGFTTGIAQFVGERLKEHGLQVDVIEAKSVEDLANYEAFVVGSAIYTSHWMKEAKDFIMKNEEALSKHPVWLFSSGPVGTTLADAKGRDLLDMSGPKEIDELTRAVKARDHRIFFGAFDPSRLTGANAFWYKMATKSQAARMAMPEGDFRDWREIGPWADGIADELTAKG